MLQIKGLAQARSLWKRETTEGHRVRAWKLKGHRVLGRLERQAVANCVGLCRLR